MWKFVAFGIFSGILALAALTLYLIKKQYSGKRCTCPERLDGKLVLITGGNSGIGKAAAHILASKGAHILLACRNTSKGEKTVNEIIKSTRNINVWCTHLDVASFKNIVQCVSSFKQTKTKLYALVNNAGIFYHPYQLSEDGFDLTLQTNYLGPFLFTYLLLDVLKASAPSRIVNVSSEAHRFPQTFNVNRLIESTADDNKFCVYGQTKLALNLFSNKLACILKGTGVTVNCANPGNVRSNIYRSFPPIRNIPFYSINRILLWLKFKSPQEGAQTIVHLLTCSDLANVSGKYFSECREGEMSNLSRCNKLMDELWNITLKLLEDYI